MAEEKVDVDKELLPFLSSSARHDLKFFAIKYFTGLSGTVSGRQFITSKAIYIDRVIELACDNVTNVVQSAISCIINLTGDTHGVNCVLHSPLLNQFLDSILGSVVMKGCLLADALAMLLSNLTREQQGAQKVVDTLLQEDAPTTFEQLIQVMCLVNYNQNADLHFLAPFLANLSQIDVARQHFLNEEKCVIQRLLPYTSHESVIRRQAVSAILKNCCFDVKYHSWLLGLKVDILPSLLLPLAGPEEFDEDDMEKLPVELQYLEPEKTREPVAQIRANLVEALTQLCATAEGRNYMREKNAYVIIREYHKWEAEEANHLLIINLVDILIGEEPSADLSSNLKQIAVPEKYQQQFDKARQEELEMLSKDSAGNDPS